MMQEPVFTAYNQATESSRIDRLQRVWGYAVGMADHFGNTQFPDKVARLHDHKGILTVLWKSDPTPGEKEFFSSAWKSSIGDGSDIVEHEFDEAVSIP